MHKTLQDNLAIGALRAQMARYERKLFQFATPQAGESMFEGGDTTGDQFNFGFVESESASNSAFGMFGSSEDSSDFGGDSGFGGDNSTGFAFNFGGEDESSSSENNCNALFG